VRKAGATSAAEDRSPDPRRPARTPARRAPARRPSQRHLRGGRRLRLLDEQSDTPLGHRNVERRALQRATARAGIAPAPRFHTLRHTFASHLIIDLRLDVAQVSRILGHASATTTLNIYTHQFDEARHADEIRTAMAA
jgi:integrase